MFKKLKVHYDCKQDAQELSPKVSLLENLLNLSRDYDVKVSRGIAGEIYVQPTEARNVYSFGQEEFEIIPNPSLRSIKYAPHRIFGEGARYTDNSLELVVSAEDGAEVKFVLAKLNPVLS